MRSRWEAQMPNCNLSSSFNQNLPRALIIPVVRSSKMAQIIDRNHQIHWIETIWELTSPQPLVTKTTIKKSIWTTHFTLLSYLYPHIGLLYWASGGFWAGVTGRQASVPAHYIGHKSSVLNIFSEYSLNYLEYTRYFLVGRARRSTGRGGHAGGPSGWAGAQTTLPSCTIFFRIYNILNLILI
jgi:hypothetical protein